MNIHLTDNDIAQMPEPMRTGFLNWLPKRLQPGGVNLKKAPTQLSIDLDNQFPRQEKSNCHVRLTQLFDAGLTKQGMPVRVKLTRKNAEIKGVEYVNSMMVSPGGIIVYQGEEFDKPSPLANEINNSQCNGWDYVEVKKDNQWIVLKELRDIWRENN
ncbi:MAG: hypothetical protein WBG70_09670 [Spirulinaceae cyanobacterium]